jgi:hypothetical protein
MACGVNDYVNSIIIHGGGWIDSVTVNCAAYSKNSHELLPGRNSLPPRGGPGGALAANACPAHTYVSGLRYGFTRDGNQPKFLDFVEFTCSPIPAAGQAAGPQVTRCLDSGGGCWVRHPDPGPYNGFGLAFESRCAPDEAVSGLVGRSGSYVDALGAVCTARPE